VSLPERLLAIHEALSRAGLPHAFGGAIALAYWTLDPRGTSDIDINIFVPASESAAALEALPEAIDQTPGAAGTIERDGQIRLWWDETPIDLFFDYEPVHEQAARNVETVLFEGEEIPILGPVELAVFKAVFDRTRDWADIEALLEAKTVDLAAVKKTLSTLIDSDDHRFERLEEAKSRADAA
jgi:hypothetical protein